MDQGNLEQAEQLLTQAVEACAADVDARRYLAHAFWKQGKHDAAIAQLTIASQLSPHDASLHVECGQFLTARGQHDQAMARANLAVAKNPQLAAAWLLRGKVFRSIGEFQRSEADLCRAAGLAPQQPDVLLALADLQYSNQQYQRCITTLQQVLDLYPPGEEPQDVLYREGLAYVAVGRNRQAVESLYAASRRGPSRAEILYELAAAELRNGHEDAARASIEQALAIDASHGPSRTLLASLDQVARTPERQLR